MNTADYLLEFGKPTDLVLIGDKFRNTYHDLHQACGRLYGELATAGVGTGDRVAILGVENDYARGYISALNSLIPEKIEDIVQYDPDTLPGSLDLTPVRGNNPDIILLLSMSEAEAVAEMIRNPHEPLRGSHPKP